MNIRGKHYIQTQEGLNAYADEIRTMNLPEYGVVFEMKFGVRTTLQNSALYLYFEHVAEALNSAGLEIAMQYLGKVTEVPWNKDSVKERLWLPIMHAMTGKMSTAKMDRNEVSEVFEVLYRHLAEKHQIMVLFPSKEQL
jgi:hypothetical protein